MPAKTLLDAAVFDALRIDADLSPLMEELATAASSGDLEEIAEAALVAQQLGDLLAGALSRVFGQAREISAQSFDARIDIN
jgi:hypothetical protein